MTDPNISHITLVCDRSSSMHSIRSDAEGAVNNFFDEQKKLDLPCTVYVVDFDAPGSSGYHPKKDARSQPDDWYRVAYEGDLKKMPYYTLEPRGNTALYAAIGLAITETGDRLSRLAEKDRPGKVFFVIQTDGEENSSQYVADGQWTLERVRRMIDIQESAYSWEFIFLGNGLGAVAAAAVAFAGTQMVANNLVRTGAGGQSVNTGYSVTSSNVAAARAGHRVTAYAAEVDEEGNVKPQQP